MKIIYIYLIFLLTLPSWEDYDEHQQEHALDNGAALFPDEIMIEIEREWMELMLKEDKEDN